MAARVDGCTAEALAGRARTPSGAGIGHRRRHLRRMRRMDDRATELHEAGFGPREGRTRTVRVVDHRDRVGHLDPSPKLPIAAAAELGTSTNAHRRLCTNALVRAISAVRGGRPWTLWRRWTGIEPAMRGSLASTALKAAEPTRYPDTSARKRTGNVDPIGGAIRQPGGDDPCDR